MKALKISVLLNAALFLFLFALSCSRNSAAVAVTSVEIDEDTVGISVGERYRLFATVKPEKASNKGVSWSSDNEDCVVVEQTGSLTGMADGSATVTVKTDDGGFKASCLVSVGPVHVTGVSVSPTSLTIDEGQSKELSVSVYPSNASDKSVEWSVSPSGYATVDQDGKVTGVKEGDATVTARTKDGGLTASCTVTVKGGDEPEQPPVYPDGQNGWTKTAVPGADGIVYWLYKGTDEFSKVPQRVSVADVDLSKYDLKFYRTSSTTASEAFKAVSKTSDAVLLMNGAYEQASIFVKIGGTQFASISNDQISSTGVPNWKNDGGICIGPDGSVYICNSIFSKDGDGQSEYGGSLEDQRKYYRITMKDVPDIFSSAPLLIDKYNPLGLGFVASSGCRYKDNSEDPYVHQRTRHPRTAVAINSANHLLMVVADGRRSKYCNGFSAKELTEFLVKYFNPKSALNMDGGGSSTMCIRGMGEAGTNVVNAPCNSDSKDPNGQFDGNVDPEKDKSHQRTLSTFFYIVKKNSK